MFIVLLRFSDNKARAGDFMDGHRAWLQRGFDDGVFLLAGTLQPGVGGGILAGGGTLEEIETRVGEDPFVAENVVTAEILDMAASKADDRLAFLLS
ncbi:YciI family protein [Roseibium aggregatum]|uniref:YCII-related domain-containing protein n=1 Tax=Roseibium aggregatum TaxID=187304 RepID=A0A926P2D7_9HYPH|nr:hypothetical protein [Roseibium aggregatum]MBD1545267.1 hypothetical protein [Roseibium aggregatum]